MKTTSARSPFRPRAFLISLSLCAVFLIEAIIVFVTTWQRIFANSDPAEGRFLQILPLFAPSFVILLLVVGIISSLLGYLRAKGKIRREDRQIKLNNPYQYYKELPNNFGIGVASLLTDSALENEKDIIAAILDLCAQKYLHLSKHSDHYVIRLEPVSDKTPLRNEAYLLELIRENRLRDLDYQKWYDYCVEDGISLGLYTRNTSTPRTHTRPAEPKSQKVLRTILIISIICFNAGLILIPFSGGADFAYGLFGLALIVAIASGATLYLSTLISGLARVSRIAAESSYKSTLERHLIRTPQGIAELQKLEAFRAFLAQFHTFVDKDPEAVLLWDRYLSYAQVFGLADELMKSGYRQLVDNAAFQIDNIDNISLSNLSSENT